MDPVILKLWMYNLPDRNVYASTFFLASDGRLSLRELSPYLGILGSSNAMDILSFDFRFATLQPSHKFFPRISTQQIAILRLLG